MPRTNKQPETSDGTLRRDTVLSRFIARVGSPNKNNIILRAGRAIIREHMLFLLILVAYWGAANLTKTLLGQKPLLGWSLELGRLIGFAEAVFAIIFLSRVLAHFKKGFAGMAIACQEIKKNYLSLEALGGFMLILATIPFFLDSFNCFKIAIPMIQIYAWDETFMKLDFIIHFGHHPWSLLQPFLGYPGITRVIDFFYHRMWGGTLFLVFLWMAWTPRRQLRAQFLLSFLITWIMLGTVLAMLFSSAGPCYFDRVTGKESPFASLMEYLNFVHDWRPLSSVLVQSDLWNAYELRLPVIYTGISAMPSIHVAAAVLCALGGWNLNKGLGWLLAGYAILIQLGSIHLGWHYAIDGYCSALLTVLIWKMTGRAIKTMRWRQPKDGRPTT